MSLYEFTFNKTINGNFRFYRHGQIIPQLAGVPGPYGAALAVFHKYYPQQTATYEPGKQLFMTDFDGHPLRQRGGGSERSYWESEIAHREAELMGRCRDLANLAASYMEIVYELEVQKNPSTSTGIGEWVLANHNTTNSVDHLGNIRNMCTTRRHSDAMTWLRANLASGAFGVIWRRKQRGL